MEMVKRFLLMGIDTLVFIKMVSRTGRANILGLMEALLKVIFARESGKDLEFGDTVMEQCTKGSFKMTLKMERASKDTRLDKYLKVCLNRGRSMKEHFTMSIRTQLRLHNKYDI
jgi:hypothetical protein